MTVSRSIVLMILSVVLVVAACGDDDGAGVEDGGDDGGAGVEDGGNGGDDGGPGGDEGGDGGDDGGAGGDEGGDGCVPTTCAAEGSDCGTISDGCGGTLECGDCTSPETCGGGGTPNVCGSGVTGACDNPSDESAMETYSMETIVGDCARSCIVAGDQEQCLVDCIQTETNGEVSTACIGCFVETVGCTKDNCLLQCLQGDSPECTQCQCDNGCRDLFSQCSGLPEEDCP